ncbi:hypothetical protein ACIGPN_34790 [Streptomyces afghaniensis]|uniref:hypothetical protein n=1 Tax=Streptomyces afghaniensis TaxID=66865 RepID=UPI0037D26230
MELLKQELRRTLAEVETAERVLDEGMRPQNLADVEALEQKLSEALQELQGMKDEYRQKDGGQPEEG